MGRSLQLRAMETSVALDVGGSGAAEALSALERAWSRCHEPDADRVAEVRLSIVLDADPDVASEARATGAHAWTGIDALLDAVSPLVTVAALTAQAGRLLMLHACAFAGPDGRSVVLVGPSGAGKTTAVTALGRTLGYLTDESVAVRDDGSLLSYPKPLSVITEGHAHKVQVSPDDAGLLAAPADCRVARVFLLARDASPEPWSEPVSTVQALAAIAPETSFLGKLPSPLRRLADALGPVGLHRLHYSEAATLPGLLGPLVED